MSRDMRFPTMRYVREANAQTSHDKRFPQMWYVRDANAQTSLRIHTVGSEPLLVAVSFLGVLSWNVLVKLNKELNTACCIHTSTLMSTLIRTANSKRSALLKHAVCTYTRS